MPGPLAAQVSMWVGYLVSGAAGALAVAAAFILPSFVFVLGVAALYAHYQGLAVVSVLRHRPRGHGDHRHRRLQAGPAHR